MNTLTLVLAGAALSTGLAFPSDPASDEDGHGHGAGVAAGGRRAAARRGGRQGGPGDHLDLGQLGVTGPLQHRLEQGHILRFERGARGSFGNLYLTEFEQLSNPCRPACDQQLVAGVALTQPAGQERVQAVEASGPGVRRQAVEAAGKAFAQPGRQPLTML